MSIKNLLKFACIAGVFVLASCGDDEVCDGKTCATGEILDATTCECINTAVCGGKTCADGETLNVVTCDCETNPIPTERKFGRISANETWSSETVYILTGKVVVDSLVTLTIEPGTIIKGETGTGSLASALIVARGGKIEACGTAAEPIIFTSITDGIQPGQTEGTLTEIDNGLWGGLILLGNAPISVSGDATQANIEGIPSDEPYSFYGGNNPTDNSGTLCYVSVRHGGASIGDGNDINGITFAGVGSGTTVNNIEVVANFDDGVEWFGGSVNVTNVMVWAADDDAIDIDQAYSGRIYNAVVICFPGTDHALEIDGPEGSLRDGFMLMGGNIVGADDEMADFRDGAQGSVQDLVFSGFTKYDEGEGDFELDDSETSANYFGGSLVIRGNEFLLPSGVTLSSVLKNDGGDDSAFDTQMASENSTPANATKGVNRADFAWTQAAKAGKF